MKKFITILLILLSILLLATACDPTQEDPLDDAAIVNVTIKTPASKILFNIGDSFTSAGLVLEATYVTGHTRLVAADGYTVDSSKFDSATEDFYDIKVTLNTAEFSVSYTVCVGNPAIVPVSISVKTPPKKLKYLINEPVETDGLVITALNNNKKVTEVPAKDISFDPSKIDASKPGNYDVIVYLTWYPDIKTTYKVNYAKKIDGIEISKLPDQTEFFLNEPFNFRGLIVTAKNIDSTKTDIPEFEYEVVSTDYEAKKATAGAKPTITVRLKSDTTLTATYSVDIFDAKAISVHSSTVIYRQGSIFSPTNISVTAYYGTGDRTYGINTNRCGIDSSAFNGNIVGEYKIKVYLLSAPSIFDYYTVKVQGIVSLFIISEPYKTQYFVGEEPVLTGLRVGAEFDDGSRAQIFSDSYNENKSAFNKNAPGTYGIIISLKDHSSIKTSFDLEVFNADAIEIALDSNHRTEFSYGEVFNSAGIKVNALYGVGGVCQVDYSNLTFDLSKYKRIVSADYLITVKLTSNPALTASYTVTVLPKGENRIVALLVNSYPTSGHKTVFPLGSPFDATGLYIRGYTAGSGGNSVTGDPHGSDIDYSNGRIMAPGELAIDSSEYVSGVPGIYPITVSYKKDPTVKCVYNVEVVPADTYVVRFACRFAPLVKPLYDLKTTDLTQSFLTLLNSAGQKRMYFYGYKFMAYYIDEFYGIAFSENDLLSTLPVEDNVITIYVRFDMDFDYGNGVTDSLVSGIYSQKFDFYTYENRYLVHKYSDTLTFTNYFKLAPNVTGNYTFSGLGMAGYAGGITGYVPVRIFEYGSLNNPIDETKEILCFDNSGNYIGYNLTGGKKYAVCYMYDLPPHIILAKTIQINVIFSAAVAEEFGFSDLTVSLPKGLDASAIILDLFADAASVLGGRFEFYTDATFSTPVNQNTVINSNATYYLDLLPAS